MMPPFSGEDSRLSEIFVSAYKATQKHNPEEHNQKYKITSLITSYFVLNKSLAEV
jgi:hypothetical protein